MPEITKRLDRAEIGKRVERAEKLLQKGKTAEALEEYLLVLRDDTENDVVRQLAADLCLSLSRNPEAVKLLGDLFEGSLRLLSPFMPFITEEVWHAMYEGKPPAKSIALARYPELDRHLLNDQAEEQMLVLQDLIEKVRNMRAEMKVEPKVKTPVKIHAAADVSKLVTENRGMVERLASVDGIEFVNQSLAQMPGARSTPKFEVALVYEQKVDVAAERERLTKDLTKLQGELANADRQLGNQQFLAKAPAQVVEGIRRRQGELHTLIEKGKTALAKLG